MKILPNKKGFTLIETLVAITILLVALAGPLTIASKGLNTAYYARDQITAFYLAQEGVEYMRNIRDSQSLYKDANSSATAWPTELVSVVGLDNNFRIDATLPPITSQAINTAAIVDCPVAGCPPLKLDTDVPSGVSTYGYKALADPTRFTREITISAVTSTPDNPDDYRITCTVSWTSPLPNHSFTLVEDITRWHE